MNRKGVFGWLSLASFLLLAQAQYVYGDGYAVQEKEEGDSHDRGVLNVSRSFTTLLAERQKNELLISVALSWKPITLEPEFEGSISQGSRIAVDMSGRFLRYSKEAMVFTFTTSFGDKGLAYISMESKNCLKVKFEIRKAGDQGGRSARIFPGGEIILNEAVSNVIGRQKKDASIDVRLSLREIEERWETVRVTLNQRGAWTDRTPMIDKIAGSVNRKQIMRLVDESSKKLPEKRNVSVFDLFEVDSSDDEIRAWLLERSIEEGSCDLIVYTLSRTPPYLFDGRTVDAYIVEKLGADAFGLLFDAFDTAKSEWAKAQLYSYFVHGFPGLERKNRDDREAFLLSCREWFRENSGQIKLRKGYGDRIIGGQLAGGVDLDPDGHKLLDCQIFKVIKRPNGK